MGPGESYTGESSPKRRKFPPQNTLSGPATLTPPNSVISQHLASTRLQFAPTCHTLVSIDVDPSHQTSFGFNFIIVKRDRLEYIFSRRLIPPFDFDLPLFSAFLLTLSAVLYSYSHSLLVFFSNLLAYSLHSLPSVPCFIRHCSHCTYIYSFGGLDGLKYLFTVY